MRTMLPVLVTAKLSQECLRPGQACHGEDRTQPPGVVALVCDRVIPTAGRLGEQDCHNFGALSRPPPTHPPELKS